MKRLAIIPARGGSTRLKNKNIYPLGGKPLIRWIVESVVKTEAFDKVIISTDNNLIWEAVADLPVERHFRPDEHATVRATALNAVLNLMENSDKKYDVVAYFLPTCPLTNPQDIKDGVAALTDEVDSVVSITEMPEPIQKACILKGGWIVPVFDNLTAGLTNSKFIQKYYTPTGAFYISRWGNILKNRNFFKGEVKGILIPPERSVDIDTIKDIKVAKILMENKN